MIELDNIYLRDCLELIIGFELVEEYLLRAKERINDEIAQMTIYDFF